MTGALSTCMLEETWGDAGLRKQVGSLLKSFSIWPNNSFSQASTQNENTWTHKTLHSNVSSVIHSSQNWNNPRCPAADSVVEKSARYSHSNGAPLQQQKWLKHDPGCNLHKQTTAEWGERQKERAHTVTSVCTKCPEKANLYTQEVGDSDLRLRVGARMNCK